MNEYQLRDKRNYDESHKRLEAIVAELNQLELGAVTKFKIQPIGEEYDFTPRFICISARIPSGKIVIICERNGYGNTGRWEFRASGWPSYEDENGSTCTIDPSSLWNPQASRPVTTAAQDRQPKAIAKQIANKIIPDYLSIYARCGVLAKSNQEHSNERAEGLRRLAVACRDENRHASRQGASFYIQELPGDTVGIDSNSHGDVQIRLHTDEMISVIALLREIRA